MSHRSFLPAAAFALLASLVSAEPLSKKTDIDFYREVPSRNLKGLATRSDGRLVAGPTLSEIDVPPPAELLWCLAPGADPTHFLIGTGPEGKIIEVTFNPANATYATRDLVKLTDPQVFSVVRLPDGSVLAGTSPKGALYLVRDGKPVARVALPVDSIFDLLALDGKSVLAATGNPGRIYKIDLAMFAAAGVVAEKVTDPKKLADFGLTVFGEIRDRNVRRLAPLADGRIVAGSSPKGNIYSFPAAGGAPVILQENHDAEVTDLLPQPNGDFYATITFSSTTGTSRLTSETAKSNNPDAKSPTEVTPTTAAVEKFGGRSSLVWFPASGFPEILTSRSGTAFYRIVRHGDVLAIAGGEAGELLGFDLKSRLALTFAGSLSSQLNGLLPLAGSPDKFLVLRNNVAGLALLDFAASGPREAETRKFDLVTPSLLGALRFNRLRNLPADQFTVELKASSGSDEFEGWTPWTPLKSAGDGWRADALHARYIKLRIRLATTAAPTSELDKASLYSLPQNHRPVLQDFRLLTPGYGIVAAVEQPSNGIATLSQLLQTGSKDDDSKRHDLFLRSQIVPSPNTQAVFWTVNDADGDNLSCTFSLRREGTDTWTDIAVDTRDSFAQFDTGHLPDGTYFTRLVAAEIAPRPVADRLTATFDTDDLVVDHTPPDILEATAVREGDRLRVTIHGRDALSLLDSAEFTFNNSVHEVVEQPVDGIRDSREETFTLEVPLAKVSNATAVEVTLYDAVGNGATRRLTW